MQIRRRERLGLRDNEVESAVRCAVQLATAYLTGTEVGNTQLESLPNPITAPPNALAGRRVAFFIASDEDGLRSRLRLRLSALGTVCFTDEFALREDMTRGLFFATVDSLLLSHSQAVISTPSSTFGYIAHGYASLGAVPRAPVSCSDGWIRPPSSEPSAHFWHPLMREARHLCINKAEHPELMQQEECCPRW